MPTTTEVFDKRQYAGEQVSAEIRVPLGDTLCTATIHRGDFPRPGQKASRPDACKISIDYSLDNGRTWRPLVWMTTGDDVQVSRATGLPITTCRCPCPLPGPDIRNRRVRATLTVAGSTLNCKVDLTTDDTYQPPPPTHGSVGYESSFFGEVGPNASTYAPAAIAVGTESDYCLVVAGSQEEGGAVSIPATCTFDGDSLLRPWSFDETDYRAGAMFVSDLASAAVPTNGNYNLVLGWGADPGSQAQVVGWLLVYNVDSYVYSGSQSNTSTGNQTPPVTVTSNAQSATGCMNVAFWFAGTSGSGNATWDAANWTGQTLLDTPAQNVGDYHIAAMARSGYTAATETFSFYCDNTTDGHGAGCVVLLQTAGAAATPKGVFGLAIDGPLRRNVY